MWWVTDSDHRQRSMFHVLHSFSLHCSICGYCQGMGPLAATLLCYLDPEVGVFLVRSLPPAYFELATRAPSCDADLFQWSSSRLLNSNFKCLKRSFGWHPEQKVYSCLVRLHDNYDMHETFLPGFPGLLEAFYVQERIMQRMIPGVYDVFVCCSLSSISTANVWLNPAEKEYDLNYRLCRQMVHYSLCQYRHVPDPAPTMGRILLRRERCYDSHVGSHHMDIQRLVRLIYSNISFDLPHSQIIFSLHKHPLKRFSNCSHLSLWSKMKMRYYDG